MTLDPRLRLLGADTLTPVAQQVLQLLDATDVTIRVGPGVTTGCDSAVVALAALASRLFGHVHINPPRPLAPNWWGISHTEQLQDLLREGGEGVGTEQPQPGVERHASSTVVTHCCRSAPAVSGCHSPDSRRYTAQASRPCRSPSP